MLPANMPMTIGTGNHRIRRAPTPKKPRATIMRPAARLAPAISGRVYLSLTVARNTNPGIVQVIASGCLYRNVKSMLLTAPVNQMMKNQLDAASGVRRKLAAASS